MNSDPIEQYQREIEQLLADAKRTQTAYAQAIGLVAFAIGVIFALSLAGVVCR